MSYGSEEFMTVIFLDLSVSVLLFYDVEAMVDLKQLRLVVVVVNMCVVKSKMEDEGQDGFMARNEGFLLGEKPWHSGYRCVVKVVWSGLLLWSAVPVELKSPTSNFVKKALGRAG